MYKNTEIYRNISDNDYGYSNDIIYKCDEYCDECGKFIHHKLMEYEPPEISVSYCEDCKKKFEEESNIDNDYDYLDEKSEDTEETLFQCPICHTIFTTEEEMKADYDKCYAQNQKFARDKANILIRINKLNQLIDIGNQLIETTELLKISDKILYTKTNKDDSMSNQRLNAEERSQIDKLWTESYYLFCDEVLPKVCEYFGFKNFTSTEKAKKVKVIKANRND